MNWFHKWTWKEYDKVYHAYFHTAVALVFSLGFNRSILFSIAFSEIWGFLWELKDMWMKKNIIERNEYTKTSRKFDWLDIAANQSGLFVGVALLIIIGWLKQMFGG